MYRRDIGVHLVVALRTFLIQVTLAPPRTAGRATYSVTDMQEDYWR
jgi:hypothetical protein